MDFDYEEEWIITQDGKSAPGDFAVNWDLKHRGYVTIERFFFPSNMGIFWCHGEVGGGVWEACAPSGYAQWGVYHRHPILELRDKVRFYEEDCDQHNSNQLKKLKDFPSECLFAGDKLLAFQVVPERGLGHVWQTWVELE